ncbi:unnamed protein product [Victoria cruziana]
MEEVSAIRQHPHHLSLLVITQTDGADPIAKRPVFRLGEGELRVRRDHAGIKARNATGISAAIAAPLLIVLGDEDDAGKDHAAVGGGVRGGREDGGAAGAATDVGSEKYCGQEYEEAKGDGDGITQAKVAEVLLQEGRKAAACSATATTTTTGMG